MNSPATALATPTVHEPDWAALTPIVVTPTTADASDDLRLPS